MLVSFPFEGKAGLGVGSFATPTIEPHPHPTLPP